MSLAFNRVLRLQLSGISRNEHDDTLVMSFFIREGQAMIDIFAILFLKLL